MADRVPLVVAGKLRPPPQRRGVVRREQLIDQVAKGFDDGATVVLVCAPAGSGKSTLIATYSEGVTTPVAWFQVDGHDNDAARFWTHLAASLNQIHPEIFFRPHPEWFSTGDWSSVVAAMVAKLEELDGVTVVIDDYHHITAGVVHEAVDQLLQWLPPGVSVLLCSRVDPPLPCLGRLRVRGVLVEVRAPDLAFDADEAAALLTSAATMDIGPDRAADLVARTEGWAAGLYLAGLSIRRRGGPELVVASFNGHDRLVSDYLRSEFLADLDDETRQFMLRTSILDELTGPLCDAVADTANSARRLRALERSNLLLIPLDSSDEWYRYHHLLEQWLRAELAVEEPELVTGLHGRAARWLRDHGQPEAGFGHAMAAGDRQLAVEVVEAAWRDTLQSGQVLTLRDWFEALGNETVGGSLPLASAIARLSLNTGRPHDEVERWLERAQALVPPGGSPYRDLERSWALHLRQRGDLLGAERRARGIVDDGGGAHDGEDFTVLGSVLHLSGELDEARDLLTAAVEASRSDGLDFQLAEGHLAAVDYELGHRREARDRAEEAIDAARSIGLEKWPTVVVANYVLGLLALDDDEPDTANEFLEAALGQSRASRYRPMEVLVLSACARLQTMQHHTVEARRLLDLARRELEAMPNPGRLADLVPVAGAQLGIVAPSSRSASESALIEDLTDRELSILRLLPSELSLRDIATELYVSHNTVKGHVKAIYRKLAVHSREDAVAQATSLGLL